MRIAYDAVDEITRLALMVAKEAAKSAGVKVQKRVSAWVNDSSRRPKGAIFKLTNTGALTDEAVVGSFFSNSKTITIIPAFRFE